MGTARKRTNTVHTGRCETAEFDWSAFAREAESLSTNEEPAGMSLDEFRLTFNLGYPTASRLIREGLKSGKLKPVWFTKQSMCGRNARFCRYCPVK